MWKDSLLYGWWTWLVKTLPLLPIKYMLRSPAKYFLQSIQNISCDQEGMAVYPPVPGLQPSPYYKFRLQKVLLSIIVTVNTIQIQ